MTDTKPAALQVVFEDDWLVVVSKPAGLLVHGNKPEDGNNLESQVKRECTPNAVLMHRLDKNTSGLVLFAKRREVAGPLTQAIEQRRIRKAYLAVVKGSWPNPLNKIESRIAASTMQTGRMENRPLDADGAHSITTFRRLAVSDEKSWIEAILKTGRQHQIRVHCESAGHSILGDLLYGGGEPGNLQAPLALHAYRMDLQHPKTGGALKLSVPPPEIWQTTWLTGLAYEARWKQLFESADLKPNKEST